MWAALRKYINIGKSEQNIVADHHHGHPVAFCCTYLNSFLLIIHQVVLEEVDESYDPTADFFRAQEDPQQQQQQPMEVVSAVPIPEGAILQVN